MNGQIALFNKNKWLIALVFIVIINAKPPLLIALYVVLFLSLKSAKGSGFWVVIAVKLYRNGNVRNIVQLFLPVFSG